MILLIVAMISTICMDMVLTNTLSMGRCAVKPLMVVKQIVQSGVMLDLLYMIMYSFGNFLVGVMCVWFVLGHFVFKMAVNPAQYMLRRLLVLFGLSCIAKTLDSHNESEALSQHSTKKAIKTANVQDKESPHQVRKDATEEKEDMNKGDAQNNEQIGTNNKVHTE